MFAPVSLDVLVSLHDEVDGDIVADDHGSNEGEKDVMEVGGQ